MVPPSACESAGAAPSPSPFSYAYGNFVRNINKSQRHVEGVSTEVPSERERVLCTTDTTVLSSGMHALN